MNEAEISLVVFACVFGGAIGGMLLRAFLPEHHLSSETQDVVKLGMGLIATMSALVLSLLVASTKTSYDAQREELSQLSSNVVLLDRVLAHYGPEAQPVRERLRDGVAKAIDRIWSEKGADAGQPPATSRPSGDLLDKIHELTPKDDYQRSLQTQAANLTFDLGRTRWLMRAQESSSIPVAFLAILVFWLTILFASFSLFAEPNPTVVAVLLVCAISVSAAIYLILELDHPFSGLIAIPSDPLKNALGQLGK
jgi:hypothetical protein